MRKFTMHRERIKITMELIEMGPDLCVAVSGGSNPHIGCVTLSMPRESLADSDIISSTTSVLNLVGHKDDKVAKYISSKLSATLNRNVVVPCGIHIPDIEEREIKIVMEIVKQLTEKVIESF